MLVSHILYCMTPVAKILQLFPALNKFESMVYGQELLFAMVIGKISSSSGGHSDRQRIRVWKKGDIKSLLFFTRKSWGCYVSIQG